MKKLGFLITMLVFTSLPTWSQGAKSIHITEVMTNNRTNLVDEYGLHKSWVELSNSSFTTYNVRGMFLTTDRRVLDKKMSPELRRQLMCPLPNNEPRTTLGGKKSIIIFDSSSWYKDGRNGHQWKAKDSANTGPFHLNLILQEKKTNWIALYDGNAVDLIDSVSVPILAADESYKLSQDFKTWDKAIATARRLEQGAASKEAGPLRHRHSRTFNGNCILLSRPALRRILGIRSLHETQTAHCPRHREACHLII